VYLQVREAVCEEDVPVIEEEQLLTDTQQARHQRIQSLKERTQERTHMSTTEERGRKRERERSGKEGDGVRRLRVNKLMS
jgi:hypothetical protein